MTFSGFLLPLHCTKMLQLIKNGSIWRENFQGQGAGPRFGPCPPLFMRLFHKNFLSSGESITFQESVGWEKLHWEGRLIPRIFPGNKFHEMSSRFYLKQEDGLELWAKLSLTPLLLYPKIQKKIPWIFLAALWGSRFSSGRPGKAAGSDSFLCFLSLIPCSDQTGPSLIQSSHSRWILCPNPCFYLIKS